MLQGEEMVWPLLEKVKTEQKFELILTALMPDDKKTELFKIRCCYLRMEQGDLNGSAAPDC